MRRRSWPWLAATALLLAGCGLDALVEVGGFKEDTTHAGYGQSLQLKLFRLVDAPSGKVPKPGDGTGPMDQAVMNKALEACMSARGLVHGKSPIIAAAIAAVAGIVVDEFQYQLETALAERAKGFGSQREVFTNIDTLPAGTCYLATMIGKRKEEKPIYPASAVGERKKEEPVPLWHVAFIFRKPSDAGGVDAMAVKPVFWQFDRSGVPTRDGGTFDLRLTVGLVAAFKDSSGTVALKPVTTAEFAYDAIKYGTSHRHDDVENGAPVKNFEPAESALFPKPPPTAFGVLTVTASEQGDGGKSAKDAQAFLERHRKSVGDLLDKIIADRLSLSRIKFDKAK